MVGAARGDEEEVAASSSASITAAASILPRRILFHPPIRAPPPSCSSALTPINLPPPPQHSNGGDPPLPSHLKSCVPPSRTSQPLPCALIKRIGAGLNNIGNTCFLNSVLQCLTYTPPLATYFQAGLHKSSCRAVAFCAMCALENHVKQALSAPGRVISPNQLVKNLRCISRSFHMGRQEDSHEYMRYLIEALQKCCPLDVHTKASPSSEKNFIQRIFGGRLQSQVKCTECAHSSNTYDPFLDLSLDIVKAESLLKALTRFTAIDVLDGDNKYFCSKCKKKVRAHKQFTIDCAPHVLTVQFKRFSSSGGFGGKIDKKVQFDRTLNLTPFVNKKEEGSRYSLYAVLVHSGWSTHSGHYFCFVRTSADMWHRLDDSRVSQVSERSVLEQKAYILFYIRETENAPTANGNHHGGASEKIKMPPAASGAAKVEANGTSNNLCMNGIQGERNKMPPAASGVVKVEANGTSNNLCMNGIQGERNGKGAVRVQANGFPSTNITDHLSNSSPKITSKRGNGKLVKANGFSTDHLSNSSPPKTVEVFGNGRLSKASVTTLPKGCKPTTPGEVCKELQSITKVQANGVLVNGHIEKNDDTNGPSILCLESQLPNGSKLPENSWLTGMTSKANGIIHWEMNENKRGSINGGCTIAKEENNNEHTLKKLDGRAACSDDLASVVISNKKTLSCDKRVAGLPLSNTALLPVPRWEDGEHCQGGAVKERSVSGEEVAHCGHILDEWDKEYDRGKRKKLRSQMPLQQGSLEVSEHVHNKKRKNCDLSQRDSGTSVSNEGRDNLFQALAGKKVKMGVDTALLKKRRKRERVMGHKLFLKRHRFKQLHTNRGHRRKR